VTATISALIITCNEEKNIKDCLDSIKWCDEIVVVDSYSKDKTVEICRQYTEKVFQREFDNFAAQRNYALEKVTGDWVLVVDADERVTKELKDEIKEVISTNNFIQAYKIPRKNYFLGKWIKYCGWYPDYVLRLFRNNGVSYSGLVHELPDIKGQIYHLKNSLIHYTYDNLEHYLQKINQYTSLAAEDMHQKGKDKCLIYILIRPLLEFLKKYIFKKGFLLGRQGLFLSIISSYYQFIKYIKLWEKNKILSKQDNK